MNLRSPRTIQYFILVLIVIGLIGIALGGYLTPLFNITLRPLITAQTWISDQYNTLDNFINSPRDVTRIQQRNADLEAEVSRLQTQIIELQQQLSEYQILSTLLDFARAHPEYQYLGATVIGRDPSPFLRYVLINRGSDHGLRRGMTVVTQQGLVGRISNVTADGGRVQLIADSASNVNIRIQPSRAEAILVGSVTGELFLEQIPQTAPVQPGNLVLTSGLGGNYPPDLLIGQMTSVRSQDYALFQSGSVQPVVDFSNLEIVLVITNFKPVDIIPLIPTPSGP